jgi:hypothetical protein
MRALRWLELLIEGLAIDQMAGGMGKGQLQRWLSSMTCRRDGRGSAVATRGSKVLAFGGFYSARSAFSAASRRRHF